MKVMVIVGENCANDHLNGESEDNCDDRCDHYRYIKRRKASHSRKYFQIYAFPQLFKEQFPPSLTKKQRFSILLYDLSKLAFT